MDQEDIQIRGVTLTRDLIKRGMSGAELAKKHKSGSLTRIRRGAYAEHTAGESKADQHRRLIMATMPQLSPDAMVSHTSAALLHGLPVLNKDLNEVHVTKLRPGSQGRSGTLLKVHGALVESSEIVQLHGLSVTNLERTILDCARLLPLGPGLAIADRGLREGASAQMLVELLETHSRRRGSRTARLVLEMMDARSESAGESMSRALFVNQGVPMPDLQRRILDGSGREVARVDFCWEEERIVGEFDGEIKYGRALKPGQSIEDVLFAEKLREDAIRDLGWEVVRWIWRDLYHPTLVVDRIERARARAARRLITRTG